MENADSTMVLGGRFWKSLTVQWFGVLVYHILIGFLLRPIGFLLKTTSGVQGGYIIVPPKSLLKIVLWVGFLRGPLGSNDFDCPDNKPCI